MKKLTQTDGMRAQLAFEMFYGAKPALKGTTITGKLVFVGYGHDKIDAGVDYINLSNKISLSENDFAHLTDIDQPGLYIRVAEGKNDRELSAGTLVFMEHGIDYLSNSSWSNLHRINLVMTQYGRKIYEWYGQVSDKEGEKGKTILPYMAISVEPDSRNKEFFICEPAEFLIAEYMGTK